jgi:HSP20 family molecular chaperone IbpA
MYSLLKLLNDTYSTPTHVDRDEDGRVKVELEVPGFNKDNLRVEMSDGLLTVHGETPTRQFFKQFSVDRIDDVYAEIKDGILTLTLAEAEKQVRKIELNTPKLEDKRENIIDAVS